jgi:hypothetical protein
MAFLRSHHPKTAFLMVVICLISFVAIGFHHHDDDRQYADCPICLAGSLVAPGVPASTSFAVYHPVISIVYASQDDRPGSVVTVSTFTPRAPPSSPSVVHFS